MTKRNMSAILLFIFGVALNNLIASGEMQNGDSGGGQSGNDNSSGNMGNNGGSPMPPNSPKVPSEPKQPNSIADRPMPLSNNKEQLDIIRNQSFAQLEERKGNAIAQLNVLTPDAEKIYVAFASLKQELAQVMGKVSGDFSDQIQAPLKLTEEMVVRMNMSKTELSRQLSDLEKLKTSLQQQYESIQQKFSSLQQQHETLDINLILDKERKASLDMRNSELQAKIRVVEDSISSVTSSIQQVEEQIALTNTSLQDLSAKTSAIEAEYRAKQATLASNNQAYKAKSGELNKARTSLTATSATLATKDSANAVLAQKLAEIENQLVDLDRNITATQKGVLSSKSALGEIDRDIAIGNELKLQLSKAVEDIKKQANAAQREFNSLNKQVQEKYSKLNKVTVDNERQKSMILKSNSTIAEVTTQNATKVYEIDNLRRQIANMYENKTVYDQQLAEAMRTLVKWKSENGALDTSIKDLRNEINRETSALNGKLKSLQKQGQEVQKISTRMQKGATIVSLSTASKELGKYNQAIEALKVQLTEAMNQATSFNAQIKELDAARESLVQASTAQSAAILNNPNTTGDILKIPAVAPGAPMPRIRSV